MQIDPVAILSERFPEIRKLVCAKNRNLLFALTRRGTDLDDAISDVYLGLLARARGTSGWDGRTSFGYYIIMASRCILLNKLRGASNARRPQESYRAALTEYAGGKDRNDPESYLLAQEWAEQTEDTEFYLAEQIAGVIRRHSELPGFQQRAARRVLGLVGNQRAKKKSPLDHSKGL